MSLVLLLGGARSGKSALALELASRTGQPAQAPRGVHSTVVYIATAEPKDEEMKSRIESHRSLRPQEWATVEEPVQLEHALAGAPAHANVVIDCLTLWVANLLEAARTDDFVMASARSAAALAERRPGLTVVVSNEVGSGIVPRNALSRRYRDLLGNVNAAFAGQAQSAYLVVAGRLLSLARPAELFSALEEVGSGGGPASDEPRPAAGPRPMVR